MRTIGFVVTPGFPVMSLAALSVFEFANLGAPAPLYDVALLSEDGGPVRTAVGAGVETSPFAETRFDTLIIGGNTHVLPTSPRLKAFVEDVARTARRVSSICTGVFALAEAGLLEGRKATTHWLFTDALANGFPGVTVERDRIFVQDGKLWTAAGNSAGVDLTLAMLESDAGSEAALAVARTLVVDHWRAGGQSQHSALLALRPKADRIQAALAYARQHLSSPLPVETLADAAGLGSRQFSRIFRAATGASPAKAVESLRLEAARVMVEQTRHPLETVARETGFGDEERMRRAFGRVFGASPQAMRRNAQL